MHDPTAIFRFEEHDVYIPMTVLEELDAGKKGLSESARNVRQVSRFLDELMRDATRSRSTAASRCRPRCRSITASARPAAGCSSKPSCSNPCCRTSLPGHGADNAILADTLALQQKFPSGPRDAGVEGHQSAHQGGDRRRARGGLFERQDHRGCGSAGQRRAAACRPIFGKSTARAWSPGSSRAAPSIACAGRWCANGSPISSSTIPARTASRPSCARSRANRRFSSSRVDYRTERNNVWGVSSRNREQNLALNLLMDPEIDFVTVLGPAGTGKTLLDARGRPRANAGSQSLQRNHHDARDDSAGRGHRLSAGHRRGKDGALDGRADGQPGGADAEPVGRRLGTRRDHGSAAPSDQDPLLELHARPHIPEPLHHHR